MEARASNLSRATQSEWARLHRQEGTFLGGPERRGRQNRKGARAIRSFAAAGRRKSPEAVPRQTVRTGNATERIIILPVAVAVETAQSKPSPIREPGTGSRRRRSAVVAELRGKDSGTPGSEQRPSDYPMHIRRVRLSWDLHRRNRIATAKSVSERRGSVSVTNCGVHSEISEFR